MKATDIKNKVEILTWDKIRNEVKKLNPQLANIIDDLAPNDDHLLMKASYAYGSKVLEKGLLMLPTNDGNFIPISESEPHIKKEFGYNLLSNPVSLVLKNSFEIYLPLDDRTIPLSGLMYPGKIFGTFRVFRPKDSYQPKFLWDMTAGARSIFMLPKISEEKKHLDIKRKYNVTNEKPASLMDHWGIFKQLSEHPDFAQPWSAEIVFFSEKWFEHIEDNAWRDFYYFFYKKLWGDTEFSRNQQVWNLIYSLVLSNYEARPSAYVTDTARYLVHIGIGQQPGIGVANSNLVAPISGLQSVYKNDYEIRKYPPIIMCPRFFDVNNLNSDPVYYSLQFPTAIEFGKNSRARINLLKDLHEIRALLKRYKSEFISNKYLTENTPINNFFKEAEIDYFHNHVKLHYGMRNSKELPIDDKNLLTTIDKEQHELFPDMCSFVKGCIRISHK